MRRVAGSVKGGAARALPPGLRYLYDKILHRQLPMAEVRLKVEKERESRTPIWVAETSGVVLAVIFAQGNG